MTSSYIVLLHDDEREANEEIVKRIADEFPDEEHIKFTDLVFIVRGDDLSLEDVTDRLRAKRDDSPALVMKLSGAASGITWKHVWSWLKVPQEALS